MTRKETELTIINKLFEIRALAKEYDKNITDITMSVSEYAEDDESEILRGMKIVRFYTNKDLDARWSSSDNEVYEPDTMDVIAEEVSV